MNSLESPKMPTDSFYKFILWLGIVFVLSGTLIPLYYYFVHLDERASQCEINIEILNAKLEHSSHELDSLVSNSKRLIDTLEFEFKDSPQAEELYKKIEEVNGLGKTQAIRYNMAVARLMIAFLKPVYDAPTVDYVFPPQGIGSDAAPTPTTVHTMSLKDRQGLSFLESFENTVNQMEGKLSDIIENRHQIEYELIQVKGENERISYRVNMMESRYFIIVCVSISIIGIILILFGSRFWFKREQRLLYNIIADKAQSLEAEHNANTPEGS